MNKGSYFNCSNLMPLTFSMDQMHGLVFLISQQTFLIIQGCPALSKLTVFWRPKTGCSKWAWFALWLSLPLPEKHCLVCSISGWFFFLSPIYHREFTGATTAIFFSTIRAYYSLGSDKLKPLLQRRFTSHHTLKRKYIQDFFPLGESCSIIWYFRF